MKQLSSRLKFIDEENFILEEDLLLTKEIQSCKNFDVYLIVSTYIDTGRKEKVSDIFKIQVDRFLSIGWVSIS